jgi:hypothetical protein
MKNELESTLETIENTVFIYNKYIDKHYHEWPESEREIANKTLYKLLIFQRQVKTLQKNSQNISKEHNEVVLNFLTDVDASCSYIIKMLAKHLI